MKEIKAYIHVNRAADVIRALKKNGYSSLMMTEVKGSFEALRMQEQEYSTELGAKVITEIKLELVCQNNQVEEVVDIIKTNADTGRNRSGAIYVSEVLAYHRF